MSKLCGKVWGIAERKCTLLKGHPGGHETFVDESVSLQPLQPRKDDRLPDGKPTKRQWSLLPWEAAAQIVDVFQWACTAKKPVPYPRDNWRGFAGDSDALNRYFDAAIRHLVEAREARRQGKPPALDQESGLSAIAHAGACVCILIVLDALTPRDKT